MKSHSLNHEINRSENGEQRLHVSYRWSTLLLCNVKSSFQNWFFFLLFFWMLRYWCLLLHLEITQIRTSFLKGRFKEVELVRWRKDDNDGGLCVIFFFLISIIEQKLVILGCYVYPHARGLRLHHRKNSRELKSYLTRNNLMCDYTATSLTRLTHSLTLWTIVLSLFL